MFSLNADTEFQRHWNRNWLTLTLPGGLVFGLGLVTQLAAVAIAGWLILLAATLRSLRLIVKYRRCSGCRRINLPRLNDNEICFYCGAGLPLDGERPDG